MILHGPTSPHPSKVYPVPQGLAGSPFEHRLHPITEKQTKARSSRSSRPGTSSLWRDLNDVPRHLLQYAGWVAPGGDYVVRRPQRSVHFVHQSVSCWESAPASRGHAESLSNGNDSELKASRRARTGGAPSTTRGGKGLSPKDVPVS